MKHKKSNIFITNRGTLGTFLNDGYYYEVVGVQTKHQNKYNSEIKFKYR